MDVDFLSCGCLTEPVRQGVERFVFPRVDVAVVTERKALPKQRHLPDSNTVPLLTPLAGCGAPQGRGPDLPANVPVGQRHMTARRMG